MFRKFSVLWGNGLKNKSNIFSMWKYLPRFSLSKEWKIYQTMFLSNIFFPQIHCTHKCNSELSSPKRKSVSCSFRNGNSGSTPTNVCSDIFFSFQADNACCNSFNAWSNSTQQSFKKIFENMTNSQSFVRSTTKIEHNHRFPNKYFLKYYLF